jgi:hypothetical protein
MAAGRHMSERCLRHRDYLHYVSVFSVYFGNGEPKFPKKFRFPRKSEGNRGIKVRHKLSRSRGVWRPPNAL